MNNLVKAWDNQTLTENGALAWKSTSNANLDFYASAGALRLSNGYDRGVKMFFDAMAENSDLAIRNLLHLRDIRQGKGERELFRLCLKELQRIDPIVFNRVIQHVPLFGRWDDLLDFHALDSVRAMVLAQLQNDTTSDHPSLLAKWMPSENAGKASRSLAMKWIVALGMTVRNYRKMLSTLRAKIKIVETQMSSQNWKDIEYSHVPSKAMKIYRSAFGKHNPEGFKAYLDSVEKGETKINSMGLMPYELIKYAGDSTIDAQWKALPDYIPDGVQFIPMCDVSDSMSGTPMDVSVSLGIYGSERNKGVFKNLVLSFTSHPKFFKLSGSLKNKRDKMMSDVGYDTNLYAAFEAVVKLAVDNNVPQEQLPQYLLVITDMEFNDTSIKTTNLKAAQKLFTNAGYVAPVIVFWNVNSRQANVGALDTDKNVILVSGLSAAIFKSALSLKATTPMDAMLDTLMNERYNWS